MAHLFEYAFGLNPFTCSGDHTNVPITTTATEGRGDYLITDYGRPENFDDVEVSLDLQRL